MQIEYSDRFLDAYGDLNKRDASRVDKAIDLLEVNPRHPSLGVKKMRGHDDIWEASASISIRITFQMQGDVITLRNVGPHDRALDNP